VEGENSLNAKDTKDAKPLTNRSSRVDETGTHTISISSDSGSLRGLARLMTTLGSNDCGIPWRLGVLGVEAVRRPSRPSRPSRPLR